MSAMLKFLLLISELSQFENSMNVSLLATAQQFHC